MIIDHLDSFGIAPAKYHFAIHHPDSNRRAVAQNRLLSKIGDVQVEVACAFQIRERQRSRTTLRDQARFLGNVGEMAITFVDETAVWTSERVDDQVEFAVAV